MCGNLVSDFDFKAKAVIVESTSEQENIDAVYSETHSTDIYNRVLYLVQKPISHSCCVKYVCEKTFRFSTISFIGIIEG